MQNLFETKEKSSMFKKKKVKSKEKEGGKKRGGGVCSLHHGGKNQVNYVFPFLLFCHYEVLNNALFVLSSRDLEECQEKEVELDHRVPL